MSGHHGVRTIAYVASIAHGGSTLLDMLLSAHSRICGVGEVARLVSAEERRRLLARGKYRACSCGLEVTPAPACPLWAELLPWLEAHPDASWAECYAALLAGVAVHGGDAQVLVDSSKSMQRLRQLRDALSEPALAGVDLRVLHLVRDVRSYATARRQGRAGSWRRVNRRFSDWYRINRRIDRRLAALGLPVLHLSYEELALRPERVLRRAAEFLGLAFEPDMCELSRSRGHAGIGNPMRMDAERSSRIAYDHRWFPDEKVAAIHLLRPRIRRYNRERVYPHLGTL